MAKLDANSEFEKGRALSVPVVKVPRSVKEWLCIDRAYENGNFKIEPMTGEAMYDQSYMFEDINYVNKDTAKKDSTLLEIMTLLKSLDGPFKITLANEQRDLDSFVNEIFNPINGQEYPVIEKGIGKWINQKIDEGTRDIRKTMILTVTCRAHSLEEAEAYFATIDTTLSNIFRNLRSRIYKMSAEERMVLLSRMLRAGEECLPPARISPHDSGWKNQILPASIQSDTDYMVINNKQYISVLVGTAFGQSLSEDKVIHSLSDVLFPTYITIDMQRVPKNVIHDRLENAHANNERVIAQERTRNYNNKQFGATTSYSLTKKKTSLEDDMDQLDENDEEGVFLGLLVLVYADSLEELTQRVDILKQKAKGSSYELEPYYHRQLKALNTVLPIGGRQVNHILREYDREVMCVICLNAKLQPVNMCICSMGAVDKAIASPREIMKTAILSNANGFIILHNHPGGSSQPSLEDIHVTDVMSKAGELLGIPLYDHIIAAAGSDEIYSFYEKGSMPQSQLKYADSVADINLRNDMAETNEIRKPLKLHQIKI